MPFVKRGSAHVIEDTAAVEITVEVEVVIDSGMDRGEPLQGLNVSKPRHRPRSKHRANTVPPKPHGFIADVDPTFEHRIL